MSRFRTWMERMGFNGKQIKVAGELIGVKYHTAHERLDKLDAPTDTELLAMAARRAGLEPWSEEYDANLVKIRRLLDVVKEAA